MTLTCSSITVFLLLIIQCYPATSQIYYVSPDNQLVQCRSLNKTCHKLSFYSQNSELFFTDDVIFYFLPGKHHLNQSVLVTAVVNLTLIGQGEREIGFHETIMQSTVIIECDNSIGGFIFLDVIDLTLKGLTITDCNSKPLAMVESKDLLLFFEYLIEIGTVLEEIAIFNASMFLLQVTNVNIFEVSIQNATQIGLLGINMYNSTIDSSSFSVNNFNWVQDCIIRDGICEGGNLIIGYTYSWPNYCYGIDTSFTLDIINSNVSLAVSTYISKAIPGGGMSIFIDNFDRYGVQVRMKNIVAFNNTAYPGGNINIATSATSSLYSFIIEGVSSMFGNEMLERLRETSENLTLINYGGGLMVAIGITPRLSLALIGNCSSTLIQSSELIVSISTSSLIENFGLIGAGLYISVQSFPRSSILQYIVLINNDFSNNYGYIGVGMYIDQKSFQTFAASLEYDLININVTNSKIKVPPNITSNGTAIQMEGLQHVNVFDILVADNSPVQGAVLASTNWLVNGFGNMFRNNSALSGGAISLQLNSVIALVPPAKIYFIDNRATIDGGAIYVINGPSLFPYCFFQIQSSESSLNPIAEWHFINNTAQFSGNSIYGANIEKCYLFQSSAVTRENSSLSIFMNTFFFDGQPIKSAISSNPNRVCFCSNATQNCERTELNVEAFPGSSITLSLSTVGIFESFSKGIVRIQEYLVINGTETDILTQNLPFFDADSCSSYPYKIQSNGSNLSLSLSVTPPVVNIVGSLVSYPSIYIFVTALPCPPGFSIDSLGNCACSETLIQTANSNITCNISNQGITRNGDVWIGYVNTTGCLFVQNNCPYVYCNSEYTTFTVYSPDPQCALMRSGILCGKCVQGYSVMIGSNKCGQCSNNYISLLVVFAIAGGVLVIFLLVLNLTVSIGTINGLIFATNVIKIYESAFFTAGSVPVLSQFISWINLDFGIEVCFYNGFNAVVKSWLQFVFPVYIWILILIVILISRYSTRFSRLIGQNILPVFATLILLSYTKLFRAIVPILQFTRMKCSSTGESNYFWSLDGNIAYDSFTHIALVVFAMAVFFVLIIPLTLLLILDVLLFSRIKSTPFCCTKILLRLKPLLDAFYGPYKNNGYFWTGILLIARLLLVVTASISSSIEVYRSVSIAIISILLVSLVYLEGVYASKWNNMIECFFLLTLSVVITFVQYSSYVTDVGVALMICAFLSICGYQVIKIYCLPRFKLRMREETLLASFIENSSELDIPTMIGRSVVEISPKAENRRETLLLESDEDIIPYNKLH